MSRYGAYVKFTARPGERDALIARLLQAADAIKDAPGCELYIINSSPTEADTVWVTEVWSSKEQHDASLSIAGAQDFIKETLPLMAGAPEQIVIQPQGGVGLASS